MSWKSRRAHAEHLKIGSPLAQLREGRLVRRFGQLGVGLVAYGVSMALLVRSNLGVMPWDVLHQGLERRIGFTLGTWSILTSLFVLLLWLPLRQMPGLGTVCNVFVVGVSVDVALLVLPDMTVLPAKAGFMVAGLLLNAMATAAYIGARMGPGPRDGLMTGLTVRTRLPLRLIRTAIEVLVVGVGWLLGGSLGLATVLYALLIGPLVQWWLPRLTVRPTA